MQSSQRLALPFIVPGQAQKEWSHNEALQMLDVVVGGAVDGPPANDPPASPTEGSCFVVGQSPTGAWAQKAGAVAAFTAAGWRFVDPVVGMTLVEKSSGTVASFGASGWEIGIIRASQLTIDGEQVVGPRAAAIADPAGGTSADAEARTAIVAILAALRTHGLISG